MFKRFYHCLIAGLYDLTLDDGKSIISLHEFRQDLSVILHKDDFDLVRIIFLPYDNSNLLEYMSGKEVKMNSLGNYTVEDIEEQISRLDSIIKVDDILPEYMVSVIKTWIASEKTMNLIEAEKLLTEGYLKVATGSRNKFLKKWIEYDLDLNNILVLKNSMDLGLEVSEQIIGKNALAEELRAISRKKSDFRVPTEPEYATSIFNIAGESDFLERESKIDMVRWSHINDLVFFEYFTIDFILAYMIKLSIAHRWLNLDEKTGQEMLKKLVTELKSIENKAASDKND
jgi:hypothetical protein